MTGIFLRMLFVVSFSMEMLSIFISKEDAHKGRKIVLMAIVYYKDMGVVIVRLISTAC